MQWLNLCEPAYDSPAGVLPHINGADDRQITSMC